MGRRQGRGGGRGRRDVGAGLQHRARRVDGRLARQVFQEIRQNPERKEAILARKGILQSVFEFLRKIFPTKRVDEDQKLTIESPKKNILDLTPSVEEVQELKNGIMQDYRDLY